MSHLVHSRVKVMLLLWTYIALLMESKRTLVTRENRILVEVGEKLTTKLHFLSSYLVSSRFADQSPPTTNQAESG